MQKMVKVVVVSVNECLIVLEVGSGVVVHN